MKTSEFIRNVEKMGYVVSKDYGSVVVRTHINDELKNSIHELAKEKLNQLTKNG